LDHAVCINIVYEFIVKFEISYLHSAAVFSAFLFSLQPGEVY